jgi:hypothetical protein
MACVAIVTVAYLIFSNRRGTSRLTAGSELHSWGELVDSLQTELDRVHAECSKEIGAVRADLVAAKRRIRDLEARIVDDAIERRGSRPSVSP